MDKRQKIIVWTAQLKKILYPFIVPAIWSLFLFFLIVLGRDDISMGVLLVFGSLVAVLLAIPISSFLYGKNIILLHKHRYLWALYNPFAISLFYIIFGYVFAVMLYVWSALWTMLPIWIFHRRAKGQERDKDLPD